MSKNRAPRIPLSEKAYRQIKERIVTVALRPGAMVDEGSLADELSIGRTPIHEAVMRLYAEELLEAVPGRGFFVRSIGIDDVRMLFEAMMVFEGAAVVLAAHRIDSFQLERLSQVNLQLKAAMEKADSLAVTYLNSSLHCIIHEATQNSFLASSLNHIQNHAQRLAYLCFSNQAGANELADHYKLVDKDHDELIELLKERNEAELVGVVTRHIQLFHNRISNYTRPSPAGTDLFLPPAGGGSLRA